jgi:oxygen-independent coproporphyrinogen-3 oxidase
METPDAKNFYIDDLLIGHSSANPCLPSERGLYLHIPFCVSKCKYCDFYSLPQSSPGHSLDSYIEAVFSEAEKYRGLSFSTVYLGGGTPSLLKAGGLRKLMEGLRRIFDLTGVLEATIEANPESVTLELLESALTCGINRLSLGVQSLCDVELTSVGRIHSASQAVQVIDLARESGFENISADIILGLPGQDWQSLMISLETLIGLDIRHISAYCLSIEPHTPLALNPPPDLPSDDEQAEFYNSASALLVKRGFIHYEISNFAVPGYECRHNLNYWHSGEYLGLGPAAASHLDSKRFKNKANLDSYLLDPIGQVDEIEELSEHEKAAEEAILRLRLLQEGLDVDHLARKYGDENIIGLVSRLNQLVKERLLNRNGANYRMPPACALVSNSILSRVLGD